MKTLSAYKALSILLIAGLITTAVAGINYDKAFFSNGIQVYNGGLAVDSGGLTVTAGGATVTAGNLVVTAGNATLTAGNLTVGGTSTLTGATAIGGGTAIAKIYHATATVLNGQTSIAATVTGVAASDRVFATITGTNTNSRHIVKAVPTTNTVTVTLSGDPGADTTVSILVIRP